MATRWHQTTARTKKDSALCPTPRTSGCHLHEFAIVISPISVSHSLTLYITEKSGIPLLSCLEVLCAEAELLKDVPIIQNKHDIAKAVRKDISNVKYE